jgi:hypothetical protein
MSSDSYNEELDHLRRSDCPLSLIFNESGSLLTLEEACRDRVLTHQFWEGKGNPPIPRMCVAFKLNFKHYPLAFLKMEYKLEDRCNEVGVTYIRPKLTDSVQDTLERKSTLNKAIKRAKENLSRKAMTKEERKKRSAKQMGYRHNKISNESEGGRLKRLKREADYKKKQGDSKFDNYCKRERVPCPPPRKNGDTGSTTRINRKVCTDAIKHRGEEKIRKEQERWRMQGCKIGLPRNAKGPGIETTEYGSKYAYGGEAAAALHSLIKDDIKNGKSTTYCFQRYGFKGSWMPTSSDSAPISDSRRCQGFVSRNGWVNRCPYGAPMAWKEKEGDYLCPLCSEAKVSSPKRTFIVRHSISEEADMRRLRQL